MKYLRPASTDEFLTLLQEIPTAERMLLAGGTDLLPRFENGMDLPAILIDLKHLSELTSIREFSDRIEIGALTTIEEINRHPLIGKEFAALAQAAGQFAGVQIRHRATIGGNICNASPAGDTLPGLYAHGARLRLVSIVGHREIPIAEFVTGPGQTTLRGNEILERIILPRSAGYSTFYKLGLRQSMAIAVFNFAISGKLENDRFSHLRIAVGAVAPTVIYLEPFTDAILSGADPAEAVNLVDGNIAPINDIRASASYRRRALKNVLIYTLEEMLDGHLG